MFNRNKLVLGILVLVLSYFGCGVCWKDRNEDVLEFDKIMEKVRSECGSNEGCDNEEVKFQDYFKGKSKKKSHVVGDLESPLLKHSCFCGLKFQLVDLGPTYFPRYINSGVCSVQMCGLNHHCKEIHYKLKVLKKKDIDEEVEGLDDFTSLPEGLKESWIPKTIKVVTACECKPFLNYRK